MTALPRSAAPVLLICVFVLISVPLCARRVLPEAAASHRDARRLSIEAGVLPPSHVGILDRDELISDLERIPIGSLTSASRRLLGETLRGLALPADPGGMVLRREGAALKAEPVVSFELYLHTDSTTVLTYRDWVYRGERRQPILEIPVEAAIGDSLYLLYNHEFGRNLGIPGTELDFYTPAAAVNIPFSNDQLENRVPFHALVALGGGQQQLLFGRERMTWGPGAVGSLLLGTELEYLDFLQFRAWSSPVDYTFLAAFFDQQRRDGSADFISFNGPRQIFIAHRAEYVPFANLRLSLTEGNLYAVDSFDLRIFNPMMYLHNYYTMLESNSLLSFELEYLPAPGIWLYGEIVIDQIQLSNETYADETEIEPNAFGFLVGCEYRTAMHSLPVGLSVEFVYTSPYLYLQSAEAATPWDRDHIVAVNRAAPGTQTAYLGFPYGPDAIVVTAGSEVLVSDRFSAALDLLFMAHGEKGMHADGRDPVLDTGSEAMEAVSPTGIPEYLLTVGIGWEALPHPALQLNGTIHFLQAWNRRHTSGAHWQDLQLTAGLRWRPF